MGGCRFLDKWRTKPEYRDWIESVPNSPHEARCAFCDSKFSVEKMGESAVISHTKGKKHQAKVAQKQQSMSVRDFFPASRDQSSRAASLSSSVSVASSTSTREGSHLSSVTAASRDVLRAEILWCLNTVTKHHSFKSSERSADLFQAMFPDSGIAAKFACGERKCNYLATYGIAPYLQRGLLQSIRDAKDYVVMFDESLNPVLQTKQMDVVVRLWDVNKVSSRFYTSLSYFYY